jgi:drug/metabolite transporter (DMT)-like permease
MNFLGANAAFGLLAAALWGGGDFTGSIAVKRTGSTIRGALLVVLLGHILSLAIVASLATLHGDAFPHGAAFWWGIGGGAISSVSLVAFYIALSTGHMGSAAAVSGLLCATVPAIVSAFLDGAPGLIRIVGFLLAGTAIWMIASSTDPAHSASRQAMVLSVLGGLGFGIYFTALKFAGEAGVLWGMAIARMGSAGTAFAILILLSLIGFREHGHADPRRGKTLLWIAGGAALDTGGNLSYLAATRMGRLDVAAVTSSLYPAGTILLAAWLLHEKTSRRQRLGMLLALPAVALITL